MQCYSTNRNSPLVPFRSALMRGQAPDRGLYMPAKIPILVPQNIKNFLHLSYPELAFQLSTRWIGDEIENEPLRLACHEAYTWPVPLVSITDRLSILELWHGPTLSFKDFAAQWLGRVLHALRPQHTPLTVLVATSGDTGSAVAAGFHNVPGIRVILLYPSGKVSALQEQQLTTFGGNVETLEVLGNFDDCQNMVKEAFTDDEVRDRIALTSANSINIGRLIPQSFYYIWAYLQIKKQIRSSHKKIVFCVPSGNLGNLTGGMLAARMGVPMAQCIAAENANNILPEFLNTGQFHPRPSVHTLSNAMDVGDPSNIVRIFDFYAHDKHAPATSGNVALARLRHDLWSTSVDDETTLNTIAHVYATYRYVMDPHTAVGWTAIERWREAL